MARVLVIGARGNMGKRYAAICRWLCHDVVGVDIGDKQPSPLNLDAAIIATPTDMHTDFIMWCCHNSIPFLCEKPIARDIDVVQKMADYSRAIGVPGYMVCNWCYSLSDEAPFRYGAHTIEYDCYNTGNDGLMWDCIQLVALAKDKASLTIRNEHPVMQAKIDGKTITMAEIAWSYVRMVRDFLGPREHLFSMHDAVGATKRVIDWSNP